MVRGAMKAEHPSETIVMVSGAMKTEHPSGQEFRFSKGDDIIQDI